MNNRNVFWGVVFIAAAFSVLFGASFSFIGISIGELFLTAICVGIMIRSLVGLEFAGILFPLAFLCIIWDKQLGLENITPFPVLLAALFGTIGLNIIFGRMKFEVKMNKKLSEYSNKKTNYAKVDISSDQYVEAKVKFGGLQKYVESEDLRRVDISAFCSGAEVYLDKACIPSGEAIVTFDCKCSGVQLYVPRDWNVKNNLDASMGAINYSGEPSGAGVVDLILVGKASFCGVDIQYV
ncbi:MAG: hypothetical protein K6G88_05180 [Lachnospiraceae bacterium]|nr:hypothetical protein [Lachnospiraceae bacterium]